MTKTSMKKTVWPIVLCLAMAVIIGKIGYYTPRTDFVAFITQYLLLFALFYYLWLNRWQQKFGFFFAAAVGLRFVLLFAIPELSNDFYRFIWDGEMMTAGINPFAHTPKVLMEQGAFYGSQFSTDYMEQLYAGMGQLSQEHYTCYPVLNQLLFFIPASISDSIPVNVIILKLIIIGFDIGAIVLAKKIAQQLSIPVHQIWLYGLNPFIILEFSGNLHFEGVMIFFLLLTVWFLVKNKWVWAGLALGCAVQIKLIPLMLIPLVFKKLKWQKAIGFTAMTLFVVLAMGGLLLNSTFFANMMESVNEYFVRFQFNSSFYNLIVNFVYGETDYDRYEVVGKGLSYIATGGILVLALLRAYRNDLDLLKNFMFAFMIYYSMATTVHPWYISLILVFSVFTRYKFGLIWSIVIMLSYYAYTVANPNEDATVAWLIVAEYAMVYGILIYEIIRYWDKKAVGIQLKEFFSRAKEG